VVYVDTPGIHQPTRPLNARMVGYAAGALKDAELVLLMVEPQARPERTAHLQAQAEDAQALALVQRAGRPTFLVINKIDRAGEGQVLATIQHYATLGGFAEIVPLSALKGTNVERLEALIVARLPTGPPYFEAEQSTDQPEEMILAELIRQEVFRRTHQEVPYSTAVRVTRLEDKGPTLLVEARIVVERPSQKAILIGRQGRMLKSLGTAARKRIEGLLGTRVYLALQVEVAADWSADPRRLAELGYPEGEA
jgi:GTP-binding protein Era